MLIKKSWQTKIGAGHEDPQDYNFVEQLCDFVELLIVNMDCTITPKPKILLPSLNVQSQEDVKGSNCH